MRFLANGPNFPDELLTARDEGQVLFFCGAGVSRAYAHLPDFYGLADRVVNTLRAAPDSPARQLIKAAKGMAPIAGVGSLLPADRVFSLLERDFNIHELRAKVAQALQPVGTPDLTAHRIILDLARDPTGLVRLVTTNFDLLFEACEAGLARFSPPRLPDPCRSQDFMGVMHLHGHVTDAYDGAHNDEFVLSSADFGRAYLADGWATRFMRDLIDRYRVVFIGYAADDPPIQYLLEALKRDAKGRGNLYAFQSGEAAAAMALWEHKGVQAIPYNEDNNHTQLWQSLEAWAERARDPNAWTSKVLVRAQDGPTSLAPFERSQIKHLVSTAAGAKAFAEASPSAEWLCCFDPQVRYGTPEKDERGVTFDPFHAYGLDEDLPPATVDLENYSQRRDVPPDAWSAFATSVTDMESLSPLEAATIPPRLWYLADWLGRICDQPAAIWWAAGRRDVNFAIRSLVQQRLREFPEPITPIETAWRWTLRCWDESFDRELANRNLRAEVRRRGWSSTTVRAWARIVCPHITVKRPISSNRPPVRQQDFQRKDLVRLDVEYPSHKQSIPFPDALLPLVAAELRRNLEIAVDLENEAIGFDGLELPPVAVDPTVRGGGYARTHGMGAPFFEYIRVLEQLAAIDTTAVRLEIAAWRPHGAAFARLRIWATGRADLLKPAEAARMLLDLDRRTFWEGRHQRDLLLSLKARWADMPKGLRQRVQSKLLAGPLLSWGSKAERKEHKARRILSRLLWLQNHGCNFSIDLDPILAKLRTEAPQWQDESADHAAASMESQGGLVKPDRATRGLENEPPISLLHRAAELSGYDLDPLTSREPLVGLAETHPAKLLRALSLAVSRNEEPANAWETFLLAEARKNDRLRLVCTTVHRLTRLPEPLFLKLIYPITEWILSLADRLQSELPSLFTALWARALGTISTNPKFTDSSVVAIRNNDWANHALNSPAGKLAQALFKGLAAGPNGLPDDRLCRAESLLGLDGAARRDALVFLAYQLPYLYHHAPAWTESHVLSVLGDDVDDERAFWSGFLWAAKFPGLPLFRKLKPYLLALAIDPSKQSGRLDTLARLILNGWKIVEDGVEQTRVSDDELRDTLRASDDAFRCQVLWLLKMWSTSHDGEWRNDALRILRNIWPRELIVKSPQVSDALAFIAIETGDDFPAFVDAVTPLITSLNKSAHSLSALASNNDTTLNLDPVALLNLVDVALPDNAADWPWDAEVIVDRLVHAPQTAQDPRTLRLRQRRAKRL